MKGHVKLAEDTVVNRRRAGCRHSRMAYQTGCLSGVWAHTCVPICLSRPAMTHTELSRQQQGSSGWGYGGEAVTIQQLSSLIQTAHQKQQQDEFRVRDRASHCYTAHAQSRAQHVTKERRGGARYKQKPPTKPTNRATDSTLPRHALHIALYRLRETISKEGETQRLPTNTHNVVLDATGDRKSDGATGKADKGRCHSPGVNHPPSCRLRAAPAQEPFIAMRSISSATASTPQAGSLRSSTLVHLVLTPAPARKPQMNHFRRGPARLAHHRRSCGRDSHGESCGAAD